MNTGNGFHLYTLWHPQHALDTIDQHWRVFHNKGKVKWLVFYDDQIDFKPPLTDKDIKEINTQAKERDILLFIKSFDPFDPQLVTGKIVCIERTVEKNDEYIPEYYKRNMITNKKLKIHYSITLTSLKIIDSKLLDNNIVFGSTFRKISKKYHYPFPAKIMLKNPQAILGGEPKDYIFCKKGNKYKLYFKGMKESIELKNKGLKYIQYLLHNKNKRFYASQLIAAVDHLPLDTVHNAYDKSSDLQPDGEVLSIVLNAIPIELCKLKIRKEEIEQEINEGKYKNLFIGSPPLKELNKIEEELEKATSTFDFKSARYLSTTIRRALDAIKKASGEELTLYNHLIKQFTPLSFPFIYSPGEEINWDTGL